MLDKLGELLSDFLQEFRWLRRGFFLLLLVALYVLGWWNWTIAGIIVISWLLYEAMNWLFSKRDKRKGSA